MDGGEAQQGAHVPDPTTTEPELGGRPAGCAREPGYQRGKAAATSGGLLGGNLPDPSDH